MSKMPTSSKINRPQADTRDSGSDWAAFDRLSDVDVVVAASSDCENPPTTDKQLKTMRRVAVVKQLRWKLELSQEEFAARLQIPLDQLRSWERGDTQPDAAAQLLLEKIAADAAVPNDKVAGPVVSDPMTYHVHKDADDRWRWTLVAANGKVLAVSGESYAQKSDCLNAISLVQHSEFARVA